jgi:hypothetical protein
VFTTAFCDSYSWTILRGSLISLASAAWVRFRAARAALMAYEVYNGSDVSEKGKSERTWLTSMETNFGGGTSSVLAILTKCW